MRTIYARQAQQVETCFVCFFVYQCQHICSVSVYIKYQSDHCQRTFERPDHFYRTTSNRRLKQQHANVRLRGTNFFFSLHRRNGKLSNVVIAGKYTMSFPLSVFGNLMLILSEREENATLAQNRFGLQVL